MSSTPYGVYQQLLSRFTGVPLEAGEDALRPALEAAARAIFGECGDIVPVLAHMMGLPPGAGGRDVGRMSPLELQRATFSAVRALLSALVERGPTVLALEDLHWSDPTSLRLTGELAQLASGGPLLVLATRRPEPDPGASELEVELAADPGRPFRLVQLSPIPKPAELSLARSMLGGEVAGEVVELICSGVDGNPLFLEERIASLLDTGALHRDGASWRLERDDPGRVPEALERLIRSRTDRLSPAAREAIVTASVLGEEAEPSMIGAVSELTTELDSALSELVAAGLMTEARSRPEPLYRFRHAVIREATYNGLLRPQRRQLHARAGWSLELSRQGRLEEVAAVLGQHLAAAGENDRAVYYLDMAGDHAARIYANDEAIASYRQAIYLLELQPDSVDARRPLTTVNLRRVAAAYEKLGSLLLLVDRFDESRAAVNAGLARVQSKDTVAAVRLLLFLAGIEYQDHRFGAALAAFDAAEELLGPYETSGDDDYVGLRLFLLGLKLKVVPARVQRLAPQRLAYRDRVR